MKHLYLFLLLICLFILICILTYILNDNKKNTNIKYTNYLIRFLKEKDMYNSQYALIRWYNIQLYKDFIEFFYFHHCLFTSLNWEEIKSLNLEFLIWLYNHNLYETNSDLILLKRHMTFLYHNLDYTPHNEIYDKAYVILRNI